MSRRWFRDPADEAALGPTLARLVEDVAELLDRLDGLEPVPVVPGSAWADPEASAVVLPHRQVPGCSLVVKVAEWSSSLGCWWSVADDPTTGPATEELFAELPLRPDGPAQAMTWLERELRRPVLGHEQGYGLARRQVWSVILDDGRELAVRSRWLPGWAAPGSGLPAPGPGPGPAPEAGLLVAAVAAAAASWAVAAATPTLVWVSWAGGAVRVLGLAAFALLLAWFRVAGSGRPSRVRVPMLAGLGLATFGQAVQLLTGATRAPSPDDPAGQAFALVLRASLPSLLATAALACWLAAVLGLPRRGRVPAWLAVAAGAGWTLDIVVGLGWLLAAARDHPEALAWYQAPTIALREAALAVAVLLLLAVVDRRPATARAGLAGAVLLVVANSFAVQAAVSAMVGAGPQLLWFAVAGTFTLAAWCGGAILLTVAAAHPAHHGSVSPGPAAGPPAPRRSPAR